MIKWKEDYELGIKHIDEQHEKLFEIADRAYKLLTNEFFTDKYDKIIEILEELKEYTVFHLCAWGESQKRKILIIKSN